MAEKNMNLSNNISVIIPVVRPESALDCITSVKKHLPNAEIISMNDTDGIGCPAMVEMLTKKATRDWILFLGDDTEVEEGFEQALEEAIKTLPDEWGVVGINTQPENYLAHWLAHKKMRKIV